ncbi:protein IWS1 homolog 1-like [Durio zibethinus]|uniref:Protein IWS1 homolog 1-like n=1 Tax=Durio zibethinus TaxID=66656 RepID=A0A6P5ZLE2_DURZI|nr:protein IWS1 homolog 1-like [Durio zibethinus]
MEGEKKRNRGKVSDGVDDHDREINAIFGVVKRWKKSEKSCEEIALFVEKAMAELEIVVEDDAQLNRKGQTAINKRRKLPLLLKVLRKKSLQLEFLDHGVLTLLKNRREQFKKSGIGKVFMFLSKSDEEMASNNKLAKDLVEKWSRIIFNKSTKFSDPRNIEVHDVPFMKQPVKKPTRPATIEYREFDLDFRVTKEHTSSSQPCSSSQRVKMPEAAASVYLVRPHPNYNAIVKASAKQQVQGECRQRI